MNVLTERSCPDCHGTGCILQPGDCRTCKGDGSVPQPGADASPARQVWDDRAPLMRAFRDWLDRSGLGDEQAPSFVAGWLARAAHDMSEVSELLSAVKIVDDWLDSDMSPEYRAQPLAHDWARITKVCSEAGEVMDALSGSTGENPRKGVCATEDDLLGELGDTACAALFAIQHRTKDTGTTWEVLLAAAEKVHQRATAGKP